MADPAVTLLATGESTTTTTTCSFTAQTAGSLLMLCVVSDDYRNTTGAGRPESTSWTLLSDQHGFHGNAFWWKLTNGSETSVQYTQLSAARSVWAVVVATNIDQTTPLANSAGQFLDASADDYTTPAISPGSGRRLGVADMGYGYTTTGFTGIGTWLNSYTEIAEKLSTANPGLAVGVATLVFDGLIEGTTSSGATITGSVTPASRSGIIAVFTVATVGATNYTQTETDAQGITDSQTWTSNTIAPPIVEAVGLLDSVARLSVAAQTVPEAVGLLDAIVQVYTPGGGGLPDFTDLVGIIDIFNQVVTNARTNGELLGIVDTANRVTTNSRTLTDVAGITDTVSAQLNQPVTYTEFRLFGSNPAPTLEQADSPLNVGLRFYTLQSNVYVTGFWWYRPTGSPATVPVRLFDQAGAIVVTFLGSAPLDGAWNRLTPTSAPIILIPGQYWTVSIHTAAYGFYSGQFATNQFNPPLFADGGPSFANNEVFIYTADPDVLPPAGTGGGNGYGVDVVVGLPVIAPQTFTDPVGLTDSLAVFNGQNSAPADVSGLLDAEAHVANYVRLIDDVNSPPQTFTEAVGLTDSQTINAGTTRQPVEAENITDTAARLAAANRTNAEAMGITDSVTGLLNSTGISVTFTDNVGSLDSQARINAQFRSIVDNLGMVDDLSGLGLADPAGSGLFYYTPPVEFDRPLAYSVPGTGDEPFIHFAEGGVGINVWKLTNGTYTSKQPTADMTTVAVEYLGGHDYFVTAAELAALTAAGFGGPKKILRTTSGLDLTTTSGLLLTTT